MPDMIENRIRSLVDEHYAVSEADILLLSNIGMQLTQEGAWPTTNDKRTLYEVVEATSGISLIRDEKAKSFIAVVKAGNESLAIRAIAARHKRYFLRELPRAFLLAFTLDLAEDQVVAVRLGPKITYITGPTIGDDTIIVDRDLRLPGLKVVNFFELSDADVERLETNVRTWCERHHVNPASLIRIDHKTSKIVAAPAETAQSNALARLYAAQAPDLASRLSVPIDIAIMLSQMP